MSGRITIDAVFTGRAEPLARGECSAIRKRARPDRVAIGPLGLDGDEQADRAHHGGTEQALHYYPADHYAYWRGSAAIARALLLPGSFGENLSGSGVLEDEVLIGDVWSLGGAVLQVSQGRQPCWKIDARFGVSGLTADVLRTGRSGWYLRVLRPGCVGAGDEAELLERPSHGWSVAAVTRVVLGRATLDELAAVALLEELSPRWRDRAKARAAAAAQARRVANQPHRLSSPAVAGTSDPDEHSSD